MSRITQETWLSWTETQPCCRGASLPTIPTTLQQESWLPPSTSICCSPHSPGATNSGGRGSILYLRYDHAGAQGKIGSMPASLELIQPAAPPMIPLLAWHWIFSQMTRRGLSWGAPVAHGQDRDGAKLPPA